MLELDDGIKQIDLANIHITFQANTKKYTFSRTHGTFSKTDYIFDTKYISKENEKFEITTFILSD